MEKIKLRDYQRNGANQLYLKLKKHDNVLFQLATGGGKTFIFSFFIRYWINNNDGNVLVLVHRKELLEQTIKSLKALGVNAEGITKENKKPKYKDRVYVSMVQTLSRRLKKDSNYVPDVKLLIVDECHRNDFNNVFAYYTNCKRVGFSATPISASKKHPLKEFYNDIVCCAGIDTLIKEGNLSNCKSYTIDIGVDIKKMKKNNQGEYTHGSMSEQFKLPKMIRNTVIAYEKKCLGKKTLIFNAGIDHCLEVCNEFIMAGYNAKYLDSTFSQEERNKVLDWFKNTSDAILCNVDILTTGFDEPSIEAVIVNRSTTSESLWLQMTGRGGRLYPGKEYFTIIDLGDNFRRLSKWEDYRDWEHKFFNPHKKPKEGVAPVKDCPECGYLNHASAKVCGECEYKFPIQQVMEDNVFDLVLLEKYKTGIKGVDMCKQMAIKGYKPHKAVHEIQKELLKTLKYVRKSKFEANQEKIINDLQKLFYPKYKELHEYDKKTFKLHPKNVRYWYDQFLPKLNERFGTDL
jgi:superfamily II DNA or RNA helicase